MGFQRRYTRPGASMSQYNAPQFSKTVIAPPRLQGPEVRGAGNGDESNMKDKVFNDPALKLHAKTKSKFGFDKIGLR